MSSASLLMLSGAPGPGYAASTMVFAGGGSQTVMVVVGLSLTGQSQQCSRVFAKFERVIASRTSSSLKGGSRSVASSSPTCPRPSLSDRPIHVDVDPVGRAPSQASISWSDTSGALAGVTARADCRARAPPPDEHPASPATSVTMRSVFIATILRISDDRRRGSFALDRCLTAEAQCRRGMPKLTRRAGALAFLALGCSLHREVRVTEPVAMSPMTDVTMNIALDRVLVSTGVVLGGFGEQSALIVVLRVTNSGREPHTLDARSIACWLELSPNRPDQTRALTPVAGGAGADAWVESSKLGSTTIPPGETRHTWVRFSGYRYPGSDVPRKVTIWFPDGRGRRVELVIADPGRGQRWEVEPLALGFGFGVQMTTLSSSDLNARAISAQLFWVWRMGPLLGDAGVSDLLFLQRGGSTDIGDIRLHQFRQSERAPHRAADPVLCLAVVAVAAGDLRRR